MNLSNRNFTHGPPSRQSSPCLNSYLMSPSNTSSKSHSAQKSINNIVIKSSTLRSSLINDPLNKNKKTSSISKSEINSARRKFTEEEDRYLTQLVDEMGPKNWDSIAEKMPNRTARQCRDRYSNYLIPGFFNGEWSAEEDENLYRKYQEIGPRWTIIQKYFKNRSPNSLKNRWNYFVSRKDFNIKFLQKPYSNGFDNMNYQQFYQSPNMIQCNYNHLNCKSMNYYRFYNQYPVGITQYTNPLNNCSQLQVQNEREPCKSAIIQNNSINSLPQVPPENHKKKGQKIKKNDQKIDEYANINDSNESVFQLNFQPKNPGMFDEEIDDYDNNIYSFDDPELFSF